MRNKLSVNSLQNRCFLPKNAFRYTKSRNRFAITTLTLFLAQQKRVDERSKVGVSQRSAKITSPLVLSIYPLRFLRRHIPLISGEGRVGGKNILGRCLRPGLSSHTTQALTTAPALNPVEMTERQKEGFGDPILTKHCQHFPKPKLRNLYIPAI